MAAELSPGDEVLYRQALALYERGDAAAAPLLEQVIVAAPGHVDARYKLANAHKEAGRLDAAAAQYREVLRRDPAHAQALNNLGAVQQMQGDDTAAEASYREAIQSQPLLAEPYVNLGRMLQSLGRNEAAAGVFAQAQDHGLDAGLFGHLLAAARSAGAAAGPATSPRAPDAYVRQTFDAFAAGFERRLVGELGYDVPQRLAALALNGWKPDSGLDVLDLGCGTGLVGDALAEAQAAPRLVGVDLSPAMLAEADKKGRYQALHNADVEAWLAGAPAASFGLIVAADVFIYIGELDNLFGHCARVLRTGGRFAFSVETCDGDGYRLLPSGRYAQADAYVARLAAQHGFDVAAREAAEIRRGVQGALYLLRLFS
jgi:predicted TPR repeat methyltransferase